MKEEIIAQICHQANREYCKTQNDHSQRIWECAPQWQKDSAINGVKFVLANPEVTPEDVHNNWLKEKQANGWVYGEVKDETKKTHPCCIPYNDFPVKQKAKDAIFLAIVNALKDFIT